MVDKEKLCEAIKSSGLTRREIASRLEVTERNLYALLRKPTKKAVERIYRVLERDKWTR